MKTNPATLVYKVFLTLSVFFLFNNITSAQCSAPALQFSNPVLYSGTDGQVNAVYKFSNVTSGVDAYITILSLNNGAKLDEIDDTTTGYYNAWQPVVDGPSTSGTTSYIKWRIDFKTSLLSVPVLFPCLTLSAIDIDGDGSRVREFIQAFGISGYYTQPTTSLTVTNAGDSVKALGPVTNSPGIDTSAWNTNININFNAISSITVETGATIQSGHGSATTNRYNCIYFQQIGTASSNLNTVLPVDYLSFTATQNNNSVMLNWATSVDLNNSYFEVERSSDNSNFKTIGYVLDGVDEAENVMAYQYKDNAVEAGSTVYYRIEQVDINGMVTYSKVVAVSLNAATDNSVAIQVYPNPFAEKMNIQFNSNESGNAEVRMISITGQTVVSKQTMIGKGTNTVQVLSLGGLPKGVYVARLMVNGKVIDDQKVVKN